MTMAAQTPRASTSAFPVPSLELSRFPEELLERILSLCVVSSNDAPPPTRPSWHPQPAAARSKAFPSLESITTNAVYFKRDRTAPLLVSKTFLRIATPLFYHTLHISSRAQASGLLTTLRSHASLGLHVRRVALSGVWSEVAEVLRLCPGVVDIDLTLDAGLPSSPTNSGNRNTMGGGVVEPQTPVIDTDAEELCNVLETMKGIQHITLRKSNAVYLTQPRPRYLISRVAQAMHGWQKLGSAHVAFRLTDDSTSTPLPSPLSTPISPQESSPSMNLPPITALTHALRSRPCLHTFSTHLPSVWNASILTISQNENLQRIILGDGKDSSAPFSAPRTFSGHGSYSADRSSMGQQHGIVGTGLFFMEARKHQRLGDLIRSGTPIIRTRAHTMGTVPLSPPIYVPGYSSSVDPCAHRRASPIHPSSPTPSPVLTGSRRR